MGLVSSGDVVPAVGRTFPLEAVSDALGHWPMDTRWARSSSGCLRPLKCRHTKGKGASMSTTIARVEGERVRTAAGIAGMALLAMAVLAAFGNFVAIEGVMVDGDPVATAANIESAGALFTPRPSEHVRGCPARRLGGGRWTLTFEPVDAPPCATRGLAPTCLRRSLHGRDRRSRQR